MLFSVYVTLLVSAVVSLVSALDPTDSISDADPSQSGYLPNHNMDPAVVDSNQFGQLWKKPFNPQEQFYAKPLVYTPNAGGPQLLFLASSQNWIRTLNAKTGDPINARQVQPPFLQKEIGCNDIPNFIGITGTPVIDPATDAVYFFAKTYIPNFRAPGATGVYNGVYYFYGVNINTLEDLPGYPILIDGTPSDNAPAKFFIGGVILQRPSLIQVGSMVYGGFGGHCDLFNYTGVVIGVDVAQKSVVTSFAVESGPLVPQTNVWNENGGGGEGGIWMSGMGLSTDGNRMFFVSGNGVGHENIGVPASGSSGCRTLGEACVNLGIGDGGKISLTDYFQPYDYINMDGGDQDFGSGGIALLDPKTFKGTGVSRMGVTAGKNGKIYVLNVNKLGGYKMGPAQTDDIVQTIVTNKAVFGGAGSYPLEGGYIYLTPVGYPTYVYKLGFSASGVPIFTQVAATPETSAGRVGVGIPTITTFKNKPGTAILWMCDPDAGLRAWYAVPETGGLMKRIPLPQVNGLNKFQRPAFGDTRLYVTDANGVLYCLGSPVNLPLDCTSPVDFGTVALGSFRTEEITCKALININQITTVTTGDAKFKVNRADLPQGAIKIGQVFTFPVTWDLSGVKTGNTANTSYGNVSPGVKSTALTITTINAIAGFSTEFPISLTGYEVSQDPFLEIAPTTVDYGGIVILDDDNPPTNSLSFTITNAGLGDLEILGYAYTDDELEDDDIDYTNVTITDDGCVLGDGFAASNLPDVGTIIPANGQISVDSSFSPDDGVGNYYSFLTVWSNGGTKSIILEGAGSKAPIANFSISNGEGGWLPKDNLLMDFGQVLAGQTPSLQIRICNEGGSVLIISKSKPPNGIFRIDDPTELHESQEIDVNDCAYGTVLFATVAERANTPDQSFTNSWTLNTEDLNFGVHVVEIIGTVISEKIGPIKPNGDPVYQYLGCYRDNNPARLLPNQVYVGNLNENGFCQEHCYTAQGGPSIFTGTEYAIECYCGNKPPPNQYSVDESFCTFSCAGDVNQVCGGNGGYLSMFYDPTRYNPEDGETTPGGGPTGPTTGPVTVQSAGEYDFIGCYSDNNPGRALTGFAPAAPEDGSNIENCMSRCSKFTYFGTEYGGECYCGNTINAGATLQPGDDVDDTGCNMVCSGNSTEYCGGPNRLNMYSRDGKPPPPPPTTTDTGDVPEPTGPSVVQYADGFQYLGCYTEAADGRALDDLENPVPGAVLTVELCADACTGFQYMGVEYGGECYCGDNFNFGADEAPGGDDPDANGCSMTCHGNPNEYCGGPNRLNAYIFNSSAAPSTTSTTAAPTAAPTPTGPVHVKQVSNFTSLGCWNESAAGPTGIRTLDGLVTFNNTGMTIEMCADTCAGWAYMGVEYGQECYCGDEPSPDSGKVALSDCNMLCPGNHLEFCGSGNRLDLYKAGPLPSSSSSSPATSSTASSSETSTYATLTGWNATSRTTALSSTITPGPITSSSTMGRSNATSSTWYSSSKLPTNSSSSALPSNSTISSASSTETSNSLSSRFGTMTPSSNATTTSASSTWTSSVSSSESSSTRIPSSNATTTRVPSSGFSTILHPSNSTQSYISSTSTSSDLSSTSTEATSASGISSETSSTASTSTSATSSSESASSTSSTFSSSASSSETSSSASSTLSSSGSTSETSSPQSSSTIASSTSSSAISSSSSTPASTTLSSTATTLSTLVTSTSSTTLKTSTSSTKSSTSTSTKSKTSTAPVYSPTVGEISSTGWQYLGCANETSPRALSAASYSDKKGMTVEACQTFCSSNGRDYGLAGLEYAQECYCGNALQNFAAVGATGCNKLCKGNSTELCGGSLRLSVYNLTTYVPPSTVQQVGTYKSQGCYNEGTRGRLLSGASYSSKTAMTAESCVQFCSSKNLKVAGLEWSQECFCAASLPASATKAADQGRCNYLCTGNRREFCGGSAVLGVYVHDPSLV